VIVICYFSTIVWDINLWVIRYVIESEGLEIWVKEYGIWGK